MTKDDIMRMARDCDLGRVCGPLDALLDYEWEALHRFANLVVAAEREACAKLCNAIQAGNEDNGKWLWEARNCAVAIRARTAP